MNSKTYFKLMTQIKMFVYITEFYEIFVIRKLRSIYLKLHFLFYSNLIFGNKKQYKELNSQAHEYYEKYFDVIAIIIRTFRN